MALDNPMPQLFEKVNERVILPTELNDDYIDEIDTREIFDHIRCIKDPEHPLTLEELNVIRQEQITIDKDSNVVTVEFTPTVSTCSMAPLIGLSIQVKLMRTLPEYFKIDVKLSKGTHSTEDALNKQLNDKERVAAALENNNLLTVINQCISATL